MATEKGLIESRIYFGLIGLVRYHAGKQKLNLLVSQESQKTQRIITERGAMVDRDMATLNAALKEILEIAKKNGYEDIRQILEEREYQCGMR